MRREGRGIEVETTRPEWRVEAAHHPGHRGRAAGDLRRLSLGGVPRASARGSVPFRNPRGVTLPLRPFVRARGVVDPCGPQRLRPGFAFGGGSVESFRPASCRRAGVRPPCRPWGNRPRECRGVLRSAGPANRRRRKRGPTRCRVEWDRPARRCIPVLSNGGVYRRTGAAGNGLPTAPESFVGGLSVRGDAARIKPIASCG